MSQFGSDFDEAIERVAEARQAIADIISRVASGDTSLPDAFLLADTNHLAGRCFAVKVLEAVPGIGKVRARRTMEEFGVDEGTWLRDVSPEARNKLVEAFSQD